jgi:rare lipoprotein A
VHASYYGDEFAWRRTASGERYDPSKLSAAHRTLPLGTRLKVTNLHNGRSVLVTINDRGPYVGPRELDLSLGAARKLGMIRRGIARVRIERVES